MTWLRRRPDLDARLREARKQRQLSEQRLADIREQVIRPSQAIGSRNQFADIIAASLGVRQREAPE